MIRRFLLVLLAIAAFITSGCAPQFKLFSDEPAPLQEFTLQGTKTEKILVLPVRGLISDQPR